MAQNTSKMWSNGINKAFFQKIQKNRPAAGGFAPWPPSGIHLSYTSSLNASPALDIFGI